MLPGEDVLELLSKWQTENRRYQAELAQQRATALIKEKEYISTKMEKQTLQDQVREVLSIASELASDNEWSCSSEKVTCKSICPFLAHHRALLGWNHVQCLLLFVACPFKSK